MGRMDFGILGVELADKFPPCLKPILVADKSNNLRRLAEPFGEGPQVAVDVFGIRRLHRGKARNVQRTFLFACPGERLPDVIIVHGHPCEDAFRPCPEGRPILQVLRVQSLLIEDSRASAP